MRVVWIVVNVATWPLALLFWPLNRLFSRRCPNCQSKWHTELVGEWDGEDWHCHKCGQYWSTN